MSSRKELGPGYVGLTKYTLKGFIDRGGLTREGFKDFNDLFIVITVLNLPWILCL